ncbi:EAL domain-containing protein [Oxalobacter paraformigenes]|uniref:Diguanylate cyclase (GGDEF) domain-containing protein n=1 Tax=Oxalobacter paraformigenes TaxID=556268 RepID=C3X4A6_9BURK|nr:EAL domain-containing protein [Oxalobacter paraformigenes]EEO28042.1 diguanylate cyclase (GGDEF) domain-containing protein [Oxalobacter paraformigenes]
MPGKTDPSNPCENRSLPGGLAEKPIGIQDWSETGLGPVSTWPDSLKNLLSVALHSGEPVCIAWGDDLVCLYNEAFHTLIDRRASSPGQSLDKLLAPLWSLLSETVECALRGTEAKASGLPLALLRNETDDGSTADFICIPVKNAQNAVSGLYCSFRQDQKENSPPARTSLNDTATYKAILDTVPVGVMQVSPDKRILYANRSICEMLGYTPGFFPERFNDLLHPTVQSRPEVANSWQDLWHNTSHFFIELALKGKNGIYILTENDISLKLDSGNKPAYALIVTQKSGKEITSFGPHLSLFDPLTSLPNRNYSDTLINNAMRRADRSGKNVAILLLDVNRFKMVNESLGHEFGDELLKLIANRLKTTLRKADSVIRMGNDEFVIVLENVRKNEDVNLVVRNIFNALSQPIHLGHHDITISVSIGCSLYPQDSSDIDTLLKYADIAKTDAKRSGSNMLRFFNRNMNITVLDQLLAESNLLRAMEKNEFLMYYQPRLCLKTGQIAGLEALIRWDHPKKGILPASEFIVLAEKIGLIHRIGEFALDNVTRQLIAWQKQDRPIPVAINVSSSELYGAKLKKALSGILRETGLASRLFELEITESKLIEDLDRVRHTLKEIRDMGIAISIDDFGTGYSSLSYLSALPVDYLKIDSSFIADVTQNHNVASIVETTIRLAHSLNMQVIAEGVETPEQLQFLVAHECDQIQGYLCSRPLPAPELEKFMERFRPADIGLTVSK